MSKSRRRHSAEFKFKVALEATKGQKTLNEIASDFGIHPTQVSSWKQELRDAGDQVFRQPMSQALREHETLQAELFEQIGRLTMELEWLKKKVAGFREC